MKMEVNRIRFVGPLIRFATKVDSQSAIVTVEYDPLKQRAYVIHEHTAAGGKLWRISFSDLSKAVVYLMRNYEIG